MCISPDTILYSQTQLIIRFLTYNLIPLPYQITHFMRILRENLNIFLFWKGQCPFLIGKRQTTDQAKYSYIHIQDACVATTLQYFIEQRIAFMHIPRGSSESDYKLRTTNIVAIDFIIWTVADFSPLKHFFTQNAEIIRKQNIERAKPPYAPAFLQSCSLFFVSPFISSFCNTTSKGMLGGRGFCFNLPIDYLQINYS